VSTVLFVFGALAAVLGVCALIETGTRWWAQRRQKQLRVTPEARDYLRRRTDGHRRAADEARARDIKREG